MKKKRLYHRKQKKKTTMNMIFRLFYYTENIKKMLECVREIVIAVDRSNSSKCLTCLKVPVRREHINRNQTRIRTNPKNPNQKPNRKNFEHV